MDPMNANFTSIPVFSRYHPIIPRTYTQAFKNDMVNRNLIVENCKLAGLSYGPHETTYYLTRRERLSCAEPRENVRARSFQVPRSNRLRPAFHSSLSRYQSSLSFRTVST